MHTKLIFTFVLSVAIMSTAMAQTPPTTSGKYSDSFPKLPPLKADLETNLFPHSQPNLLQMSHENKDSLDTLSIMFRHKENNPTSRYHYRSQPDYTKMVDNFGDLRDHIVRKRRKDEGRPLQPLPPPSMRNR
jgi:hypothetical protein